MSLLDTKEGREATVERGRYGKLTIADPDELLNTIPAREYPEPRRFDPDPDRERDTRHKIIFHGT